MKSLNKAESAIRLEEIIQSAFSESFTYQEFRAEIDRLLALNRVTGMEQNDHLIEYSKLNVVRMNRWNKSFEPNDKMKLQLKRIAQPYTWLVITEGWCGDSAQILPIIHKMASFNDKIELKIVLRDAHSELMDEFLTDGTRGIPKLICTDHRGKLIFQWGPRPQEAIDLMNSLRESVSDSYTPAQIKEKLHLWYARDRANAIQKEFLVLLNSMN